MKRPTLMPALGRGALAGGPAMPQAFGQTGTAPRRLSVPTVSNEAFAASLQELRDGLRERGHVEGQNVIIDLRHDDGRVQDLPRLAAELAALGPALFIATGTSVTNAALEAGADLPVVLLGDLVAAGHAAQLDPPGCRVTGIRLLLGPLNAKRLDLLASILPKGSAVLKLGEPNSAVGMTPVEAAADGDLVGYGPGLTEMFRQRAGYASRMLAGAQAVDLPIEPPTRFNLVINLKTAKVLDLTLPRSLLLRADEAIQ